MDYAYLKIFYFCVLLLVLSVTIILFLTSPSLVKWVPPLTFMLTGTSFSSCFLYFVSVMADFYTMNLLAPGNVLTRTPFVWCVLLTIVEDYVCMHAYSFSCWKKL